MNVRTTLVFSAVLGLLAAGNAAAQKLTLRVEQGLVTLDAENVTIDEILARWNSITGLNVVSKNGRGSDIPVTLHISSMPERDALALVLRDLSGYIMGERRDPRTGLVSIDRVMILPDSAAQASSLPPPRVAPRPPAPTFDLGGQQLELPASSADNAAEPDDSDDDTPRELAPRPASPFAGGASLGPAGGQAPSALAAPFAIAPLGVISDDSPAGLNSPTLAPGQVVAPQTPPNAPPPVPTKENPFAAAGAAQPGVIVPAPGATPGPAESPTPSLRIQSAPATPE